MSSGFNLKKGNEIVPSQSPLEQLSRRKALEKNEKSYIIEFAKENSLTTTAAKFSLSDTSVAKILAPLIKKGEIKAEILIDPDLISSVEEAILRLNSSSIKRVVENSEYNEAEIRIVKAELQRRGAQEWQ